MESEIKEDLLKGKVIGLKSGWRVRSRSTSGVLKMWKRKRETEEGGEEKVEREEAEERKVFQRSKKTARLPTQEAGEGGDDGSNKELDGGDDEKMGENKGEAGGEDGRKNEAINNGVG